MYRMGTASAQQDTVHSFSLMLHPDLQYHGLPSFACLQERWPAGFAILGCRSYCQNHSFPSSRRTLNVPSGTRDTSESLSRPGVTQEYLRCDTTYSSSHVDLLMANTGYFQTSFEPTTSKENLRLLVVLPTSQQHLLNEQFASC